MGWKNVKEHYRIGHQVQVTEHGICIGSPYIHGLLVIALDGTRIVKPYVDRGANENLWRYQKEMDADMGKLWELVNNPDTFEKSLPVFTYKGGQIIEKQCEEYGWPNVTHDGDLMYENTHSKDKAMAVKWAKESARSYVPLCQERKDEKWKEFLEWEQRLKDTENELLKLELDYPD